MTKKQQLSPWIQKSSKIIYDNPWIKVSHDIVTNPSGNESIYGRVHFKNHAVGILPVDDKGGTWLVRQTRYLFGEQTWEIPEGGSPVGEELLLTAQRELLEETGLSASHWELWLNLQLSNSVTDEVATIYLARDLVQGDMKLEETEDITVRYLPLKEAVAMVHNGEIVDAMSVAALLKVAASPNYIDFM